MESLQGLQWHLYPVLKWCSTPLSYTWPRFQMASSERHLLTFCSLIFTVTARNHQCRFELEPDPFLPHLRLHVGCSSARGCSNFGCFAEDLLLLQCHAVLTCSITVFFIVENGISVVNQQLILLGRWEELSAKRKTMQQKWKLISVGASTVPNASVLHCQKIPREQFTN